MLLLLAMLDKVVIRISFDVRAEKRSALQIEIEAQYSRIQIRILMLL